MFSKAPIKRYYDSVAMGPGPTAYDPKLQDPAKLAAIPKGDRFQERKEETPGPGTYKLDIPIKVPEKVVLQYGSKLPIRKTESVSSINSIGSNEVFKTPIINRRSKLERSDSVCSLGSGINRMSSKKIEKDNALLREKLDSVSQKLFTISNLYDSVKKVHLDNSGDPEVLEKLEKKQKELNEEREEFLQAQSKVAESLDLLAEKEAEIDKLEQSRNNLFEKIRLLSEDNEVLETSLADIQQNLENFKTLNASLTEEKNNFEEKNTFLHFTQEQLNNRLNSIEETHSQKITDLTAQIEELTAQKNDLVAYKFCVVSKLAAMDKTNEAYDAKIMSLIGEKNDLLIKTEDLELIIETLKSELEDLKKRNAELESEVRKINDAYVLLKDENKKIEKEKNELCLDLTSVSFEKNKLNQVSEENVRLEQLLESLRLENTEEKRRATEYEAKLTDKIIQAEEWDKFMCDLKEENETLKSNLQSLEITLLSYKNESSAYEQMAREVADLRIDLESKMTEIEDLKEIKKDIEEAGREAEEAREVAIKDLSELNKELTDNNKELEVELENLKENKLNIEDKLKNSESLFDSNVSKMKDLEKELVSEKKELLIMNRELSDQVSQYLHDIQSFQKKEEDLLCKLSEIKESKLHFEHLHRNTKESMEKQINSLKMSLYLSNDKIQSLENKVLESTKSLEVQNELDRLKEELIKKTEIIEKMDAEKVILKDELKESQDEAKRLAEVVGSGIGHQNHRQKIQVLVKLKTENVDLKLNLKKVEAKNLLLTKKLNELKSAGVSTLDLSEKPPSNDTESRGPSRNKTPGPKDRKKINTASILKEANK